MQDMDLGELDELEDLEDERVLDEYRRKRMQELQDAAGLPFGEVVHISKSDYSREVTEASKEWKVVVLLYQSYLVECQVVVKEMRELARERRGEKYVMIKASECIENYPDRNCPTVLVYERGELVEQRVRIKELRGVV